MEGKAEIIKYRSLQLPKGGMITVNQLYSLYEDRGHTFVDQSLEVCMREKAIRKFTISNASPVILRMGKGGIFLKVTYGYENTEVVLESSQFLAIIDLGIVESEPATSEALEKFRSFVNAHPDAHSVTNDDFGEADLARLVNFGVLTLTSNHHNELDIHHYAVSYPRCGSFLKMINAGRMWLVRTLGKSTYAESLEDALFEKWTGKVMANFRKPFYGYDLLWILADAQGSGVVEAFETPVGRGWRLTGKL